jgi:hypothetical protein
MASGWDFPNLLFHEGYPSGNDEHFSMENHLIEMSWIFPMNSMVMIFHSYGTVYQRVSLNDVQLISLTNPCNILWIWMFIWFQCKMASVARNPGHRIPDKCFLVYLCYKHNPRSLPDKQSLINHGPYVFIRIIFTLISLHNIPSL